MSGTKSPDSEQLAGDMAAVNAVLLAMKARLDKTQTRVIDVFRKIDYSGDGKASADELRKGLLCFGFELNDEDFSALQARLDRDGSGDVTLKELAIALRDAEKAAEKARRKGHPAMPPRTSPVSTDTSSTLWTPRPRRQSPPRRHQEILGPMDRGDEVLCMIKAKLNRLKTKMLDVFRVLDEDGEGTIDQDEFRVGLKRLGFKVSDSDFVAVMNVLDKDGNGDVSIQEFAKALRLAEKKARNEGRGAELDTFESVSSVSRVEISDFYDWSQRSMRIYHGHSSLGSSLRDPCASPRSWCLASGGPSEAAFTNKLHCGSFQDSSVARQRFFDSTLPPTVLPPKVTSPPQLPTYKTIYSTATVSGRFGSLEPTRLPNDRLARTWRVCENSRRKGPEIQLSGGLKKFLNSPMMQSTVDQVVFGRDMDDSGDTKFDPEFTAMFKDCAGKASWHKKRE